MNKLPQIIMTDSRGVHNTDPHTTERILSARAYEDLSTIIIVPNMGKINARVVQNWMGIIPPMNQKLTRIFALHMEVGASYSETISMIVGDEARGIPPHPDLSTWKYIFTLEHDNMVEPDVLLKLYEDIKGYDAVGSIYFTKGDDGMPMCYGDPTVYPANFVPFLPPDNSVTRCRGLGMGATLFRLDMFKDPLIPRPWFETIQKMEYGKGYKAYTQDLKFFEEAGKAGYKFACSTRTRTGHYCDTMDIIY